MLLPRSWDGALAGNWLQDPITVTWEYVACSSISGNVGHCG